MALVTRPKNVTVPDTLSGKAAEVWRSAFNSAYDGTCEERDDRDACAAKIAWSAVKQSYRKNDSGEWVRKIHVDEAVAWRGLLDAESIYDFAHRLEDEFKQEFGSEWWVADVLMTGHVVAKNEREASHWRVPYEVIDNDHAAFGPQAEWVEVSKYKVWQPVVNSDENRGRRLAENEVAAAGSERPVYRQDEQVEDGNIPAAVQPDRPIIPTPQNLTRAEAEIWNRNYLEAIEGECSLEDNPRSCAARIAWDAVNAFGEEADLEDEETVEPDPEEEDEAAPEDEAEGEEEDRPQAAEEDEEADDGELGDEDEGEGEEEQRPVADDDEEQDNDDAESEEEEGEAPSLDAVMSKVAEGESLTDAETEVLAAAVDAAKEGESDEAKNEALDQVMAKVSAGEELSEDERNLLSAAISALSEKSAIRLTGRDLAQLLMNRTGLTKNRRETVAEEIEERRDQSPEEHGGNGKEGDMSPEDKNGYTERQMKALIAAGRALPDGRFPIVNKSDLTDSLNAVYRSGIDDPEAIGHIIVRAGSMGALGLLPDDWMNKGTAMALSKVTPDWVEATVERVAQTMEDRAWLQNIGEDTKITRPPYFSSQEWGSLPAVERTARAEYLRQFVKRMYDQAVDDMHQLGWKSEPVLGRDHELQFKRWIEHEEGPLLQRAILVRKVGTTDWKPREVSRGASLSSAIKMTPDEVRL